MTANEGPQLLQLQLAQLEGHTRPLTNERRPTYPAKKNDSSSDVRQPSSAMTHTSLRVFAFAVKVSSFAGPVVISMVAVGPAAASLAAPCVDATAKAPLKPLLQRKAIGSCLFDSGNVEHRVVWCLVSADS